ncbi:MAG: hypothetical protein U0S36_05440 [Candidatus Nanopelagicales bacterium]
MGLRAQHHEDGVDDARRQRTREEARVEGEASGDVACDEIEEVAARSCRLMDGYALEVLLGAPGRTRAWAVAQVRAALDRELAVR